MPIDRTDRKILQALKHNGRITNADLAEAVALSPSPCLRRVKRLEDNGTVTGYRADLDRNALGWQVSAIVHLKSHKAPQPDIADDFRKAMADIPQVVWAYGVAGSSDLIAMVVAKDFDDYYEQIQKIAAIDMVSDLESYLTITQIKADGGLPVP